MRWVALSLAVVAVVINLTWRLWHGDESLGRFQRVVSTVCLTVCVVVIVTMLIRITGLLNG